MMEMFIYTSYVSACYVSKILFLAPFRLHITGMQVPIPSDKPQTFAEMCGGARSETLAMLGSETEVGVQPEHGEVMKPVEPHDDVAIIPGVLRMIMDMGHTKEEALKIYKRDPTLKDLKVSPSSLTVPKVKN